jgi:hypothetical protein
LQLLLDHGCAVAQTFSLDATRNHFSNTLLINTAAQDSTVRPTQDSLLTSFAAQNWGAKPGHWPRNVELNLGFLKFIFLNYWRCFNQFGT